MSIYLINSNQVYPGGIVSMYTESTPNNIEIFEINVGNYECSNPKISSNKIVCDLEHKLEAGLYNLTVLTNFGIATLKSTSFYDYPSK